MGVFFKEYFDSDFPRILDFLSQSHREQGDPTPHPWNWWIDRLNFTATVSLGFTGLSHEAWARRIGLWQDGPGPNAPIVAVVLGEGEGRGETFVQTGPDELDPGLLEEVFDFIETRCPEAGVVNLRIPERFPLRAARAEARGFRKTDWQETQAWLAWDRVQAGGLPEGFRLVVGAEVSDEAKAHVHSHAWGYHDQPDQVATGRRAFARVRLAPDYRPDLDLLVLDPQGRGAAMAAFWYDADNRWGILEPMATRRDLHRRGLGRALIAEGARRLQALGATGLWVGNDLAFYLGIGFEVKSRTPVWTKEY